jgi:hypothetical protein
MEYTINCLVKERLANLSIKTLNVIPYKHINNSRQYVYIYIYQIINDVRVLIKMLNTHIFMVYIPDEEQEEIESLLQTKNMKELSRLYFERYLNISPSRPYCELGMFYMETLPEKFSFTIKENGHKNKITELDILCLLYNFWRAYYSDNFYGLVVAAYSSMYNQCRNILHDNTPVTLFTDPYDHSQHKYITLQSFLKQLKIMDHNKSDHAAITSVTLTLSGTQV